MQIENNSPYLVVLPPDRQNPARASDAVSCECLLCGREKDIQKRYLRKATVQSCGCLPRYKPVKDYTGQVINGALALGYVSSNRYKFIHTLCGHSGIYTVDQIKRRKSAGKCRGCWMATKAVWNKRHGRSRGKDRTYSSWLNMRRRCYEPNNNRYYLYGGRGIRVCERWQNDFDTFLKDMEDCPEGCSLDRVDVNKDYSPENCKWSTGIEQSLNKRVTWKIKIEGEWMSLKRAAEYAGVNYKHAHYRIRTCGEDVSAVLGNCVEDVVFPNEDYQSIIEEF